ncbi:Fic family protein [Candidatus Falkowbacteria bacterium]|jgi:Fic family protein|nr:Fic family protein [Candidatus Falkowbacteria bacterium]MBT4432761.1 Fic family protein [Candidatus Falkowbacteria bacterium]
MDFYNYFKIYKKELKVDLEKEYQKLFKKGEIDFNYLIEASAVYSSNIEGNSMDLNSFMNSKGLKVKQRPKEFVEITDLVKAYNFSQKYKLTESNFLKAHKILSKTFLVESRQGVYREEKVGVFDSGGLVYLAVEPENVKKAMKDFFQMINDLFKKEMTTKEVFFWASIIHLRLAHIHSFSDGNGRIARLAEKWFLASKLDGRAWGIQSEKYYKENLNQYYKKINLGVNYYELNYDKCIPFLLMLPKAF